MIHIYSRENCAFCLKAKNLLNENNIQYQEIIIGKDIDRNEVIQKFPNRKLLPIVLTNDTMIGGYEDLVNYISTQKKEI